MIHFVYAITAPDGRSYIGVTTDVHRRIREHARAKTIVGRSLRKHGVDAHTVRTLLVAERDFAYEMEEKLVGAWGALAPEGMNALVGGVGGWEGHSHTPATRSLLSVLAKAKGPRSDATKAKLSVSRTGLKCAVSRSSEARARQGASMRAVWEHRRARGAVGPALAVLAKARAGKAEYRGDKAKADAKNRPSK